MSRYWGLALVIGLAITNSGCGGGDGGPKTYPVYGSVNLDGKPLPQGDIKFVGTAAGAKPYAGKIVAGKYSLRCEAGKWRVEISSMQVVPGKKGPGGTPGDNKPADVIEETVPLKYNRNTTLTADVASSGKNSFDFKLDSSK